MKYDGLVNDEMRKEINSLDQTENVENDAIQNKLAAVKMKLAEMKKTHKRTAYTYLDGDLLAKKRMRWTIMDKKIILANQQEWYQAKNIMHRLLQQKKSVPFQLNKDSYALNHSYIVANNSEGVPTLGVVASNSPSEGILGYGGFGVCKLISWENGSMSALKIEPLIDEQMDQYEQSIMLKLGLLQASFTRSRAQRASEKLNAINGVKDGWIDENTKSYKIMPLVKGISLKIYLYSSATPSQHTMHSHLRIATSLVTALMHLHNHGVIHNDLHNDNIMVDDNLKAHLIDFGKSIDLQSMPKEVKRLLKVIGRNDTLAPEIFDFKDRLLHIYSFDEDAILDEDDKIPFSSASDIYSLGLLFESLFQSIRFNAAVEDLVTKMLNSDPCKRIDLQTVQQKLCSQAFLAVVEDADELENNLPKSISNLHRDKSTRYQ